VHDLVEETRKDGGAEKGLRERYGRIEDTKSLDEPRKVGMESKKEKGSESVVYRTALM
jgi:hypothetical protein